jgi:hypothetical protein
VFCCLFLSFFLRPRERPDGCLNAIAVARTAVGWQCRRSMMDCRLLRSRGSGMYQSAPLAFGAAARFVRSPPEQREIFAKTDQKFVTPPQHFWGAKSLFCGCTAVWQVQGHFHAADSFIC